LHPLLSGMKYRATGQAQQEDRNVHVIIKVDLYDDAGPIGAALFDFGATLTGVNNLDEAMAVSRAADYFPGGLIADSAGGVLAESGNVGEQLYDEKLNAIAIRSFLY